MTDSFLGYNVEFRTEDKTDRTEMTDSYGQDRRE